MALGSPAGVLFDFGGTLDADGTRWSVRFHEAYRAESGRLTFETFEPVFQATDRALEQVPGIRDLGFRAMIEAQSALLAEACADERRVDFRRVAARFHTEALRVIERNRPMLARLAQRSALGIVSNFTGNLDRCLSELGLLACFRVTADSAIVGAAKPEPRIFVEALAILDTPVAETWMVGDNFEADIRPASALGLNTCWLAPSERVTPDGVRPTARVAQLTELEALFG